MTVENIIKAVRFCYDEEALNAANFGDASSNDNTLMDNIIKSKIGDALRWVCLYAPAELLTGKDGDSATTIVADKTPDTVNNIPSSGDSIGGSFSVENDFLRLIRVRGNDWHRAVMTPIEEDSEEYLQLYDTNGAAATKDRPQAAIIYSATKKIEVYPKPTTVTYTYVKDPLATGTDYSTTAPSIPTKAQGAFIYYLAFLVLSAYEDSRAPRMLEIAKMNISRTDNVQKK